MVCVYAACTGHTYEYEFTRVRPKDAFLDCLVAFVYIILHHQHEFAAMCDKFAQTKKYKYTNTYSHLYTCMYVDISIYSYATPEIW